MSLSASASSKVQVTYPYNALIIHDESSDDEVITNMATSVRAVEEILNYKFQKTELLEEALTHPSCTDSPSYQRLKFLGVAALGSAISTYIYLAYPKLVDGQLSLLLAANIKTEKLARVAVRHCLYKYVRHNTTGLDEKVKEFVISVGQEKQAEFLGGAIKAPKVLAHIVESVAAAVFVDCGFDLKTFWVIFRGLLEPIITLDLLSQQPQHVTMLYEICRKDGNGQFIVSASSENKENIELHAAKTALKKLAYESTDKLDIEIEPKTEIEGAKQKLNEICGRKKWSLPTYRIEKQVGPAHDKRFICSVQIAVAEAVLFMKGEEKSRVKYAENSAASAMIWSLQDSKLN